MLSTIGRLRGWIHIPFDTALTWRPTLRCIHDGAFPHSDSSPAAVAGSKSKTPKHHAGPAGSEGKIRRIYVGPDDSSKATYEPRASQHTRISPSTSKVSGRSSPPETNKEDYRRWLEKPVKPQKPRPCKGILMNSAADLEALISTPLHEDPLLAFADCPGCVDTTIVTASACLRLYVARTKQQAVSRKDFRNRLMDSQAGSKGLSWFLRMGHHESLESIDLGLLSAMTFCIVGGHSTHIWWELVESNFTHEPSSNRTPDLDLTALTRHRWRRLLLRNLVEAQAYWSEGTNMFNEPLESFLRVALTNRSRHPMSGAYAWLVGNMTFSDKRGIDVGSYDEFCATTIGYGLQSTSRLFDKGCLELTHPKRPNPRTLLEFFCDAARESQRRDILDEMSAVRFKLSIKTLAHHLHCVGNMTDARAVVDSAVNILRRGRQPSSIALRGMDVRFIKRKATRREIEAGAPVDASGYRLPNDVLNDAERKSRKALYMSNYEYRGG